VPGEDYQRSVRRESLTVKRFGGNALGSPRFTFYLLPFMVLESILLMRRTLIDSSKHLCATMHRDEILALPVAHAHRPVQPLRSGLRTAHG
jgi:hypothetical protein